MISSIFWDIFCEISSASIFFFREVFRCICPFWEPFRFYPLALSASRPVFVDFYRLSLPSPGHFSQFSPDFSQFLRFLAFAVVEHVLAKTVWAFWRAFLEAISILSGPLRLRLQSRSRTRLRIAASIAFSLRACFKGVWDTIAPLSRGWAPLSGLERGGWGLLPVRGCEIGRDRGLPIALPIAEGAL